MSSQPELDASDHSNGMAMPALLEVTDLTKRFGRAAVLTNIHFALYEHEILGIIGPNGSGKTTLMECLAGMLPVDSGRVMWRSGPLPRARRKERLFYVPDGVLPYGEQAVETVLGFYREAFGHPVSRLREVIRQLALGEILTQRGDALSKGYRRRLLLALGLLSPQPLLLLDEPFDGFDLRQTLAVMALLHDEVKTKRTLLVAIHQLTDAERICDRFLLLSAGRVLGQGTLDALRQQAGVHGSHLEEVFLALT